MGVGTLLSTKPKNVILGNELGGSKQLTFCSLFSSLEIPAVNALLCSKTSWKTNEYRHSSMCLLTLLFTRRNSIVRELGLQ